MKGERIIAELIGVLGMIVYGILLQHLYMEMLHEPEKSWLNQLRAWWITRRSREKEARLRVVWNAEPKIEEP